MLALCRPNVGPICTLCRPYVGPICTLSRPHVGPMSALCRPYAGPMSALCRPYVGPSYNASLHFIFNFIFVFTSLVFLVLFLHSLSTLILSWFAFSYCFHVSLPGNFFPISAYPISSCYYFFIPFRLSFCPPGRNPFYHISLPCYSTFIPSYPVSFFFLFPYLISQV